MPTVDSAILIFKNQSALFRLSQDYKSRLEWDPFLKEISFLNGATAPAKGVQVKVVAKNSFTMTVQYIFLNEPKSIAIQMIEGPFFFRKFAGSWKFVEVKDEVTRVSFRYSFEVPWYALKPISAFFIKRIFQKNMDARLASLKNAAETTDIINRMDKEYLDIELNDEDLEN